MSASQAAAPFARYENDRERDAILRSKTHFGDPMAGLLSSGPQGEPEAVTARYDVNKLKQSGKQVTLLPGSLSARFVSPHAVLFKPSSAIC